MFAFPRLRSRFLACTHSRSGFALLAGLLLFSPNASASALAQDATRKPTKAPTVELKSVVAKGGWKLQFAYFNSGKGKESPVVILLHGKNSNHLAWNAGGFARKLQQQGYAVIALDLRKHGRSKAPTDSTSSTSKKKGGGSTDLSGTDYQAMILLDLPAVKRFIYAEHQAQNLNMRKTAIIAADMSGPIALNYAAYDWSRKPYPDAPRIAERTPRGQDVRALVLLSPELNLPKVLSGPAIRSLRSPAKNIAFLVCYGKDPKSVSNSKKIVQQLGPSAEGQKRIYDYQYPRKDVGTDLLGKGLKIETNILTFLDRHLKTLPGEWRDRKSKLLD